MTSMIKLLGPTWNQSYKKLHVDFILDTNNDYQDDNGDGDASMMIMMIREEEMGR